MMRSGIDTEVVVGIQLVGGQSVRDCVPVYVADGVFEWDHRIAKWTLRNGIPSVIEFGFDK